MENANGKTRKTGERQTAGEYFVVRSSRIGESLDWAGFNVSGWLSGFLWRWRSGF
jgi:hypothetical protein